MSRYHAFAVLVTAEENRVNALAMARINAVLVGLVLLCNVLGTSGFESVVIVPIHVEFWGTISLTVFEASSRP
jgi:hypothetical protein